MTRLTKAVAKNEETNEAQGTPAELLTPAEWIRRRAEEFNRERWADLLRRLPQTGPRH